MYKCIKERVLKSLLKLLSRLSTRIHSSVARHESIEHNIILMRIIVKEVKDNLRFTMLLTGLMQYK